MTIFYMLLLSAIEEFDSGMNRSHATRDNVELNSGYRPASTVNLKECPNMVNAQSNIRETNLALRLALQ
jgi:hypothetical protein